MSEQPVTFAAMSGDPEAHPGNIIELGFTERKLDVQASDDD
jgi:hypothetical protein